MKNEIDLKPLLELSSKDHSHLCPRQVLGVRIGLKGLAVLGLDEFSTRKHLLVISETDGCFIDGIIAATKCTVGHRTLRVEDYGKIAATFVNIKTEKAVRILPQLDVRERADRFVPDEPRHYFAQLQAYQTMPDDDLLLVQHIALKTPVAQIISRIGARIICDQCGEDVINEREIILNGKRVCRTCAQGGYYE